MKKKIEFFFHDTLDFQILGDEVLIITGYEDTKNFIFHYLAVKLWLESFQSFFQLLKKIVPKDYKLIIE